MSNLSIVGHFCNHSTWEMEEYGQGYTRLHSESGVGGHVGALVKE